MNAILNNYQVFPQEYFSGIDCYIAFNNIPIDKISQLEFALQENIIPVYGYASYTYDAVAHGVRLVTGSFTIPFRETFYIRAALEQLQTQGVSSARPKRPTSDMTAEQIAAWIKGMPMDKLEEIADEYGKRLWGNNESTAINKYRDTFFVNASSDLAAYGFDIIVSYGSELIEIGKEVKDFPSAAKIINGVHLTGVGQVIQPTGEPIYEKYTFIARDLDNTIINTIKQAVSSSTTQDTNTKKVYPSMLKPKKPYNAMTK